MVTRSSISRSPSSISAASTLSNIQVIAPTGEASHSRAASGASTPPTSLAPESTGDAASIKQQTAATTTTATTDTNTSTTDLTRRSSRPRSSIASYNVVALSNQHVARTAARSKETRDFSGATLVDDDQQDQGVDTPKRQQKLLDDASKALDIDWQVGPVAAIGGEPSRSQQSSSQLSARTSGTMHKISNAAGKLKSALGKRGQEAMDSGREMLGLSHHQNKRKSGRLQVLEEQRPRSSLSTTLQEKDQEDSPEPAAKKLKHSPQPAASSSQADAPGGSMRARKLYQTQGLWCGQPADLEDRLKGTKSKKRTSTSLDQATLSASAMHNGQPLLPLPMFSKLKVEQDFVLPYDVFAPTYPVRGQPKPEHWQKVFKNRFVGDAKELWRHMVPTERSLCICKRPSLTDVKTGDAEGCGENCLNRALGYECDDSNCNLGDLCTNRAFAELAARTKKGNEFDVGVEVLLTKDRGFGVRANRCFAPGQIIIEYAGEVVTQEECERRMREEYQGNECYYLMTFDQGMIIDATRGSIARFVNHSCEPNCRMEKRTVSNAPRMALFAGPNGVMTGDELTYDYNFDPFSQKNVQSCHCGAANCRGVLGPRPKDTKIPRSKVEKENLTKTLTKSLKRKVDSLLGSTSQSQASSQVSAPLEPKKERQVLKKRKTARFSKGWVYVDEEMEKTRMAEDRLEKGDPEVTVRVEEKMVATSRHQVRDSPFVVDESKARRSGSVRRTVSKLVNKDKKKAIKREDSVRETDKVDDEGHEDAQETDKRASTLLSRAASVIKASVGDLGASDKPETQQQAQSELTTSSTDKPIDIPSSMTLNKDSSVSEGKQEKRGSKILRQSMLAFPSVTGAAKAPADKDADGQDDEREELLAEVNVVVVKTGSSEKEAVSGSGSGMGSKSGILRTGSLKRAASKAKERIRGSVKSRS